MSTKTSAENCFEKCKISIKTKWEKHPKKEERLKRGITQIGRYSRKLIQPHKYRHPHDKDSLQNINQVGDGQSLGNTWDK